MLSIKEQLLKTIKNFPKDITLDDAMEELYLIHKINKGIEQIKNGKTITHNKAKEKIKKWLKK